MLDKSHSSVYQYVQDFLDKLKKSLSNGENYQQIITELDTISALLLTITSEEKTAIVRETHRELRLLKTDLLFLLAAKTPDSQMKRLETIQQRLTRINDFSKLLL